MHDIGVVEDIFFTSMMVEDVEKTLVRSRRRNGALYILLLRKRGSNRLWERKMQANKGKK